MDLDCRGEKIRVTCTLFCYHVAMQMNDPDLGFPGLSLVMADPMFLVVDKPAGLPSVPLKQQGADIPTLLGCVGRLYPEVLSVQDIRPWEGGVVHRLDTATSGLVVVARTSIAWALLIASQKAGLFQKEYEAFSAGIGMAVPGFPPYTGKELGHGDVVTIGCQFRPWGVGRTAVRPLARDAGPDVQRKAAPAWYLTTVVQSQLAQRDGVSGMLCRCRITEGFRHQIRCHLAWAGWPLYGDVLYGGKEAEHLYLRAQSIRFPHPADASIVEVTIDTI